ncbi:phage baseplate assembly protein V [Clostridium sp. MD294]|uniref:phage baseplate assembly protein V n=1 Tax=Clostridium sp. MD294 TaxID=97138 RepID=UPI0002CC4AD9|nr:phage baseplate assembly protein V [Clostridium sp. MD294]NDO46142.1 hypothetical protein [Clostridium sp. MD294]USF30192.1 Actin cross-linking toxin VgrG1 [Clostridium sp. MD294]
MSILKALSEEQQQYPFSPVLGIMPAIVTDIDDPEKLGRIKVKLLNRDTSEYETDFIRIMTPMTGQQWGMFFFPEVGDEVLVGFSGGEIARPYVLGALWNKNNIPPVTIENKENKLRKIKTKNGNELIFCDKEEENYIQINTPNQLEMNLNDKEQVIHIKEKNNKNRIKIDVKNGVVTIEGENKIDISSGNSHMILDANANKVSISSGQYLEIKSGQIVVEAKSTLDLKANGSVNIKSDGATNVKGAVVKLN